MNLSKQIKKYRNTLALSQEELAEKLFVSRQTISNWENERSYPDIHNLLLLSVLFDISLDELVKGDVETMKDKISKTEMDRYTKIMLIFCILTVLSIGPSLFLPDYWRYFFPAIFWIIAMYGAIKVEQIKKSKDVKTYKEILAFMENKNIDEARNQRNKKKDVLSKVFIVVTFAAIAGIIAFLGALPYIISNLF